MFADAKCPERSLISTDDYFDPCESRALYESLREVDFIAEVTHKCEAHMSCQPPKGLKTTRRYCAVLIGDDDGTFFASAEGETLPTSNNLIQRGVAVYNSPADCMLSVMEGVASMVHSKEATASYMAAALRPIFGRPVGGKLVRQYDGLFIVKAADDLLNALESGMQLTLSDHCKVVQLLLAFGIGWSGGWRFYTSCVVVDADEAIPALAPFAVAVEDLLGLVFPAVVAALICQFSGAWFPASPDVHSSVVQPIEGEKH